MYYESIDDYLATIDDIDYLKDQFKRQNQLNKLLEDAIIDYIGRSKYNQICIKVASEFYRRINEQDAEAEKSCKS